MSNAQTIRKKVKIETPRVPNKKGHEKKFLQKNMESKGVKSRLTLDRGYKALRKRSSVSEMRDRVYQSLYSFEHRELGESFREAK